MTELTIYSTAGEERYRIPINEGAKRVVKLMADDYVTLPFKTNTLIDFQLGDWVEIPNEGRFCLTEKILPSIDDENGGYSYELKFDAQYKKWGSKIFKYRPLSGGQECSWSLTASISVHAEQVQTAINSLASQDSSYLYNGGETWHVLFDSSVDSVVAKPITFDNINILDGISSIAETFECEWWVVDNYVWFGRCEFGDTEVELSRELNVNTISRSDTGEKTANRIYPFGSTENIPPKYNKELIFNVSNISAKPVKFYDSSRLIQPDWFDESMVVKTEYDVPIPFKGNAYGERYISVSPYEYPICFVQEVSFEDLKEGKFKFLLDGFKSEAVAFFNDKKSQGSFDYQPQIRLAYKTEYIWESDSKYEKEDSFGNIEQIPMESINHSELHYFASTEVTGRRNNFHILEFEDDSVELEIPEEVSATKKVLVFDYEGAYLGTTNENITLKTKDCLKKSLYFELRVLVKKEGTLTWSTTDSSIIYDTGEEPTYEVNDIKIEFLSGELSGETFDAVLKKGKTEPNYWLNVYEIPNTDFVEFDDEYKILNINEDKVPASYYTHIAKTDDHQVINAIADGRLKLPLDRGSYIDAYRYDDEGNKINVGEEGYEEANEMPLDEAIEDVVIFEDIRPDYEFTIKASWFTSHEVTTGDSTTIVHRFFFFDDLFTAKNQFKEKYRLEGKELAIRFSSGKLNGTQFVLAYYNSSTLSDLPKELYLILSSKNINANTIVSEHKDTLVKYFGDLTTAELVTIVEELIKGETGKLGTRWEVIVDEETKLPNSFYAPEATDKFTISGLNVTIIGDQYVPKAEQELYDEAVKYVQETNLDASAYDCVMKSEIMANGLHLELGQKVLLKEKIFFKNGRSSRVIGYEYPLDIPYDNPKYTIGEKPKYSRLGDIESKLESLEFSQAPKATNVVSGSVIGSSSSSSVHVIGTNDTTPASDKNVLSSLRSLAEFVSRKKNETINYLWRFAKGIEIGQYFNGVRGAKINDDGDAEVESLTSRSTIDGNVISATEYIQSSQVTTKDFAQGSLSGTGGGYYTLNGLTYAEFDYLTARKGATFAELIIQEYRSIAGSLVVSEANGEIESVYKFANGYNVWLKDVEKNSSLFEDKDLVRCQYWDRTKNELVQYWVPVSVGTDASGKYVLTIYNKHLNGVEPQVGDKLVHMGNTTDTNRQGCILLTTENGLPRISVLDGIDEPKIYNTPEKTNYKSIYGSLDGFTDPYTNKKLSGYGLWGENVHLHGEFTLSSFGNSIEEALANNSNGGRNLLVGTNKGSTGWAFSSNINNICTIKSIDHNGASGVQFLKSDATQIPTYETFRFPLRPQFVKKGKIYHLTFDAMQTANNNDVLTLNITLCKADSSNFLFNTQTHKMKSCDGKWHHFDIEFSAIASGSEDSGQYVYLAVRRGQSDNQYWSDIAFANLKLEEGFNSTDWTLAPEDVVSSFTEFKVTADGLTSRVTNSEGKISAIEQNAESISLKVGNLEKQTISTNNLLLKSNEIKENKDYLLGSYNFGSVAPQDGEEVTLSFSGYLGTGHTYFNIYNSGWSVLITRISSADYNQITKRFEKTFKWVKSSAENTLINIFQAGASGGRIDQGDNENPDRVASKVFNAMLTKSNKAVDWQPSSEDATKALLDTGIDIENKKVTLTADNFVIQNNEGKPTSSVDANGNWSTNALATKDDNDSLVITINKDNDRMQKFYYPNGKVRTEFGWDDVSQSLMRYYDELGNMLWKVGSASAFVAPSYKEWEEVLYYFSGYRELEYFDLVKSIAQSSSFPNDKKPSYIRTTPGSTKFYSEAQALQEYLLNGIYVGPSVLQYTEYDSFGSKVWEDWARDVYCFKDGDQVQDKYETIYWREYYGSNEDEEIE